MSNVIRFPGRFRPAATKKPAADDEPDDTRPTERQQRFAKYAKWRKWKADQRRWGGGLYKPSGDNRNAIAHFEIDRIKSRSPEYRQAMAVEVLKVLLENGRITIGYSRLSDRIITRCLNANLNFRRDGHIPVKPPRWLVEELRFEALRHLKTSVAPLVTEGNDDA